MKNEERTIKNKERKGRILFSLFSLLFLFSCNIFDSPESYMPVHTPHENGYGRINISLTGGHNLRTVLPVTAFDSYVYTFFRAGEISGSVKTPDHDGYFTLEAGFYTVQVQAYIGKVSPVLAASGVSAIFNVGTGNNARITVLLTSHTTGVKGTFNYTIDFPENAEAEITLTRWPDMNKVTLTPQNLTEGNGITGVLELETGSYMFTVLVSKNGLYAGKNDAVHIYPLLSTVYTKSFSEIDLLAPAPVSNAEIIVTAPVKGATPDTTASGGNVSQFTAGTVSWFPADSPFLGGTVYTATVTLTAKSRWTFTGLSSATIEGQDAVITNNTGAAVTLSYTFTPTADKLVTDIAIKTQPASLTYTHGNLLDLTGLVVTLTYEDSVTEDVAAANFTAKHISANPAHGNYLIHTEHNGHPVTITYGDLPPLSTGNLTVNAIGKTFTVDPVPSQTYSGSAHTPAVTVKDDTDTLTLSIDYTVMYAHNINAGTAAITITGIGNYADSTGSATFTIMKADPVVTWPAAASIGYGAALSASSLSGGSGAGTFTWTDAAIIPTVTNSGYSVTFTPDDTGNYNTLTHNAAITVNRATLIVAADDFDIAYNDPAPAYTYRVSNFHHGEHTEVLSGAPGISCNYSKGNPSGNYPIIITQGTLSAANYTFSFENGTLSVGLLEQAALSINNPGAKTYGDAVFNLSTQGGSGTGALHFEITSGGGSSDIINLTSGGQVTITGTGNVTVKAVKAGDDNYNHTESDSIAITVGKRNVKSASVSFPGTYPYTGSAVTPTPVVDDIIDSVNRISTADYTVSYSNNINTGTASATIEATEDGNYTGSTSANFTIRPNVPQNRFEYYWVDQHGSLVTTSGGAVTVAPGVTLIITSQAPGYVVKQWHINGEDTGQSGNTYNFSSETGKHTIGLFVEKDGKLYNTNITITVQ